MKRFSVVLILLVCGFASAFAQTAQPCAPGVAGAIAFPARDGIDVPPIDGIAKCAAATREIACGKNGTYVYTFTITNNTGSTVTSVLLTPPIGAGYSISPQSPPLPGGSLANGQSATLQVTITGGQAGQKICFPITLLSKERGCCTVEVCVTLPNCCAIINTVKLACNPDGTYSYTFTVTNRTSSNVQHIYLHAPAGTTITPSYFAVSLAAGATSQPLTVTISGAKPGRFCYGISLHTEGMKTCCTFDHCIELPECGGPQASCRDGVCCSRAPMYDGTIFVGQKVAAVTGTGQVPGSPNYVLTVFDMSGANGFGTNGNAPPPNNMAPKYNGPAAKPWTMQNLGSVFGVDIDHLGNIYVTSSSAYSIDAVGLFGHGAIYKIDTGSGDIKQFANLPNVPDSSGQYPELGNIAFDCARKQFFVTNEDDGRIYRLDINGTVTGTFDHATGIVTTSGAAEPGDAPGFAPLGERLWGVQVHNGRVYYAVWKEDCGNKSANLAVKNEIWSIALSNLSGNFDPADRRLELTVPDLAGTDFSNPTSDIAFSRDGKMLIAERSMANATRPDAHASRVLELTCTRDGWVPTAPFSNLPYHYNVGAQNLTMGCPIPGGASPANAAGGVDYDYDPNATYGMWATGDALRLSGVTSIYGFEGFPLSGGSVANTPLLALYGQGGFKTQIGDIEVSCPPNENPY